jgi:hypothetical protein
MNIFYNSVGKGKANEKFLVHIFPCDMKGQTKKPNWSKCWSKCEHNPLLVQLWTQMSLAQVTGKYGMWKGIQNSQHDEEILIGWKDQIYSL